MRHRTLLLTCALAAGLTGSTFAHAPDSADGGVSLPTTERTSHTSGGLRDWFSAPKYNETEADVTRDEEELAIQRTTARLSGGDEAAFDRLEKELELRGRIARWRAVRDRARKAGDTARATRTERRIHSAKQELAVARSR
jgi:hypothetical protein